MIKKSLLFASFVVTTLGQQLIFDPPTLDLSKARDGQRVKVSVAQVPPSNMYVHFNTPELLRLDNCQLIFGPGSPQSQTITIRPSGSTTNTAVVKLSAKLITNGNAANAPSVDYSVNPFIGAPKVCTSIGDPHYKTFDGTSYTFMGTPNKWYYLVNSLETSIQTEIVECNPGTTCNRHISIRHFDGMLRVRSTSEKNAVKKYSLTLSGNQDMFMITQGDSKLEVQLLDGSSITLSFNIWKLNDFLYTDVHVQLPATYRSRVSGLCGDFNDVPENANDAIAAGARFVIPNEDVIATSSSPSGVVKPQTNCYRCSSATSTKPGGVFENYMQYFIMPRNLCVQAPKPGQSSTDYCNQLFNPLTCNGFDKTPYLQACIADCSAVGEKMQAQGAASVKAYQEAVGYQARTLLAAGDISGSKTLENCGRIILTPFKMEAAVDNGRVKSASVQGNPFAIAGVCERADGSYEIAGLQGAGSESFGSLSADALASGQSGSSGKLPSFTSPSFQVSGVDQQRQQRPTFAMPSFQSNFQLPKFNISNYF